jgi:hypothetical protein
VLCFSVESRCAGMQPARQQHSQAKPRNDPQSHTKPATQSQPPTAVCVAADGVSASRQGHHLVVRGVADGGLHVEVVDDEVGLVPPACSGL